MTEPTISKGRRGVLYVCSGLALILGLALAPAQGQGVGAAVQGMPTLLHIEILEGEGALNNIRQRDAREPVVQITDENHKPVSSVAVLFLIQGGKHGAGATFGGDAQTLTVTTGPDGIAHAAGLTIAQAPGSFSIAVTATLGSLVATSVIHESIVLSALGSAGGAAGGAAGGIGAGTIATHTILGVSKIVFIAVGSAAAAGVVAGVVVATTGNSGTSLTLGQGTITQVISGPHSSKQSSRTANH